MKVASWYLNHRRNFQLYASGWCLLIPVVVYHDVFALVHVYLVQVWFLSHDFLKKMLWEEPADSLETERAWFRNFKKLQESITSGLLLHFVNVEDSYRVGMEYVPQLPILDLCQEAELLLSGFEASLKGRATREELPSFFPLFFLFHYCKSASQHWSDQKEVEC